jgi:hypothetical protein
MFADGRYCIFELDTLFPIVLRSCESIPNHNNQSTTILINESAADIFEQSKLISVSNPLYAIV